MLHSKIYYWKTYKYNTISDKLNENLIQDSLILSIPIKVILIKLLNKKPREIYVKCIKNKEKFIKQGESK